VATGAAPVHADAACAGAIRFVSAASAYGTAVIYQVTRRDNSTRLGVLYFAYCGPVHLAYNPSYSAFFLAGTVFFSQKKSANSVFQPAYNSSRTALYGITQAAARGTT
jgi:hypothetical protein